MGRKGLLAAGVRVGFGIILMAGPFALLGWLFKEDSWRLCRYVLSGRLFASSWDRIHAGFVLDQPTIGKWYFWFTAVSVIVLPYLAALRRLRAKARWLECATFKLPVTLLCLFLLCLLTIPFWWVVQYIGAMGWTQRRFSGLAYGLVCYAGLLAFWWWAMRGGRGSKAGSPSQAPVTGGEAGISLTAGRGADGEDALGQALFM